MKPGEFVTTAFKVANTRFRQLLERDVAEIQDEFALHESLVAKSYGPFSPGFSQSVCGDRLNLQIKKLLEDLTPVNLSSRMLEVHSEHLLLSALTSEEIEAFALCYVAWELPFQHPTVIALHNWAIESFLNYFNSPISIVNSRAWLTKGNSVIGPFKWHTDGFGLGHAKIMIYPDGLSEKLGGLEIEDSRIHSAEPGAAVAFQNSVHRHRAVPPPRWWISTGTRDYYPTNALHSTPEVCKSLQWAAPKASAVLLWFTRSDFMTFLLRSRLGHGLRRARTDAVWLRQQLSVKGNPRKVNIGSGDRDWSEWLLLDEVRFPKTRRFRSTPNCTIPLIASSAELVYSSHHLEHLDDNSVNRIIAETHRVLTGDGYFVVKIPNFSLFKENYIVSNHELLEFCGVHDVVNTWKEFGIKDSFAARTAMMFCGYWNTHYGNHFSGQASRIKGAYHGPPILPESKLDLALRTLSIRELSRYFNREALSDPNFKQFNHQNAWETSDFIQLVEDMGFKCATTSCEAIRNTVSDIPDLLTMPEISAYYLFKKRARNI